jgi:hypothetical protein
LIEDTKREVEKRGGGRKLIEVEVNKKKKDLC